MPGAQPRRSFQQRMGSTARRGALTPSGVPGVYRVPRRTVATTAQAVDLGAAGTTDGWVQPDDVLDEGTNFSAFLISQYGTGGEGVDLNDWYSEGSGPSVLYSAQPGSAVLRWETVILVVNEGELSMPPVSPTPPPGMTVEYESPQGTPIQVKATGRIVTSQSGDGLVDPANHQIRAITAGSLDPGRVGPYSPRVGPVRPWSGSPVWSYSGSTSGSTVDFDTGYQAWPDGTPRVGWQFGEVHSLNETEAPESGDAGLAYGMTVFGPGTGPTPVALTYDYRPPRYRFV